MRCFCKKLSFMCVLHLGIVGGALGFACRAVAEAPSFLEGVEPKGVASQNTGDHMPEERDRQASILFDEIGQVIGFVDENGRVIDSKGQFRMQVQSDGAVTDAQGIYVGMIDDNGEIFDREGNYRGVLRKNGAVVDSSPKVIGEVVPMDVEASPAMTAPAAGAPAPVPN